MDDYSQIISSLRAVTLSIRENVRLADYTTFKIGGLCPLLAECRRPQEVEGLMVALCQNKLPFFTMGGGSNLIISDKGLDCIVIRYFSEQPQIKRSREEVEVVASTKLDDLALFCAEQGLAGLNFASGIYGTVAGAIVGNAGAFGKQISDRLKSVVLVTPLGEKKEAGLSHLGFAYRDSLLKKSRDIVLEAQFVLEKGSRDSLLQERREILQFRRQKHPDIRSHPCAGSVFRNLEPTSLAGRRQAAGWLLEQSGAKDFKVGGAAVFEKHANIIINTGRAAAQDVYALSQMMAGSVFEKFNIKLLPEVCFVGDFDGQKSPAV